MLVDLAFVGYGHVGRRFARLLDERRDLLERELDLTYRVTGIATSRHGAVYSAEGVDALTAARLVEAGGSLSSLQPSGKTTPVLVPGSHAVIDALSTSVAPLRVLVETSTLDIAAAQPALEHVRLALEGGCHVVTANKGPVAFAYEELSAIAARRRTSFLFEGAVMDGIPVFNLVRETMPAVTIEGFRGVVNSTTNHILTALEDGDEYAPALAHMQAEGIAEADPSLDVDGWDAAAKAAALANVFLASRITPHDVDRIGIGPGTASWAREAKTRGGRVRLVASARRGSRPVVHPVELPEDDLLAGLRGMANALILDTDTLGRVVICQLDGGLTHTAYALLSDLITIRRGGQITGTGLDNAASTSR
jgi:homoserine dehydrogenase